MLIWCLIYIFMYNPKCCCRRRIIVIHVSPVTRFFHHDRYCLFLYFGIFILRYYFINRPGRFGIAKSAVTASSFSTRATRESSNEQKTHEWKRVREIAHSAHATQRIHTHILAVDTRTLHKIYSTSFPDRMPSVVLEKEKPEKKFDQKKLNIHNFWTREYFLMKFFLHNLGNISNTNHA